MMIVNTQKPLKVLLLLRPSLHCEKVDELKQQTRLATTRFAHSLDQLAQSRNKPIVTDTKQWPTRNISHARSFDHEHSRTPFRKPSIPIEILLCDETIVGGTPRHHRRHPRPAARLELADLNSSEQSRSCGFFSRGPARFEYLVTDWFREFPHVPLHRLHGLRSEESRVGKE